MALTPGSNQCSRCGFWALCLFLFWLAHAAGYLLHEYAHSVTAWLLGYKANPFALHYGHLDWNNVLTLGDVDENVDYDPIFATGRGASAALIAVAGVLFGNGLGYLLSRYFYARSKLGERNLPALFCFLLCVMNAGNLISYVPARTFATHADMAIVEKGLQVSPWWVAILLGLPFCIAVWHVTARLLPRAMRFFFRTSAVSQAVLLLVTSAMLFWFYGGAGLTRYGPVSHAISACSVYGVLPAVVLLYWPRRPFQKAFASGN